LRSGTVSVSQGLETLLAFPSVDSFTKKWDDVPLFSAHAKRYLLAFRPDCGIAFHETDRYKNPRAGVSARAKKNLAAVTSRRDPASFIEVGVFATRDFKKGDVINLRGGVADLTEEEDDEMRLSGGRSDFSVLWSERKNCFCLLLGPARFVNHDCRNNVEFQLVGSNMSFKVLEDIRKDEEIFTHYGAHYFETDNAACLCATCEQLKQGAFMPASKRKKLESTASEPGPSSRSRRDSSPGPRRASSRAAKLPEVNYNEKAPIASTSASASTSLVRSASVSGGTPSRARPSSSRFNPVRGALSVVDAVRSQPRIVVQPKLPPPPGYGTDYEWDAKKKTARYVGPQTCVNEDDNRKKSKPSSTALARSASAPALALTSNKRRRLDSDSPAPVSTDSPRARSVAAPVAKRPRSSQVQLKKVRLGERKSSRLSVGTASARERTFARLNEALGQDDSSDLSDEEEDGPGGGEGGSETSEGEERQVVDALLARDTGKAKAVERTALVEAEQPAPGSPGPASCERRRSSRSVSSTGSTIRSRSVISETPGASGPQTAHVRTVTLDLGFSTSTPLEEPVSPQFPTIADDENVDTGADRVVQCAEPESIKDKDDPPIPDRPRRSIPSPNFYSRSREGGEPSAADGGEGSSSGANGSGNGKTTNSGGSSFWDAPSSANSSGRGSDSQRAGRGTEGGAGGSGGDDGDDRRRKGRTVEPADQTGDVAEKNRRDEDEEEQDKKPDVARDGTDEKPRQNAASLAAPEDPQDAVAALLMLLAVPEPAPGSTATTPPSAASTEHSASNGKDASDSAPAPSAPNGSHKGKRAARSSDASIEAPTRSSSNPRSTRRHSQLDDESPVPAELPESHGPKAKKPRLAGSPTVAAGTTSESSAEPPALPLPKPRSNIRWGKGKPGQRPPHIEAQARAQLEARAQEPVAVSTPSPRRAVSTPTVVEKRQTRSRPIPGRLEDVLSAPETLAATGGYDWEKGRYISKLEQARAPSANPRPERPVESPSPPPVRRRRPASVATSAPAPPVPPAPVAPPTPTVVDAKLRARSPAAPKPARRRASASPAPSTSHAPASPRQTIAPPEGIRATRRSFPIAAPLRDIIYSSTALAATGGWDEESGRYIGASSSSTGTENIGSPRAPRSSRGTPTTGRRASSSTPTRPTNSAARNGAPAAPSTQSPDASSTRSTRRSNPIPERLNDLVYSSAVGGWDPEKGKYVSTVAARKAALARANANS
ncbi:hypothetical protein JCM10212_000687, partial [Sporobolomyces blumeae]